MRVTVLGSGGSGGVPLPGGEGGAIWGAADPKNPRNRRRRVSVWVQVGGKSILIDTSPDLREQIIDAGIADLDAVFFTHAHADHAHGLDDLRAISYRKKAMIEAFMDPDTHAVLTHRFDYAFESSHAASRLYPAVMKDHAVEGRFKAAGIEAFSFRQDHGNTHSMGYRIGGFAYSTDVVRLDDDAFAALEGLDLWIVDCLREEPHPTHSHFAQTLEWIDRAKPKRAVLTHLNHSVDYEKLSAKCPPGVELAYDGMVIELPIP